MGLRLLFLKCAAVATAFLAVNFCVNALTYSLVYHSYTLTHRFSAPYGSETVYFFPGTFDCAYPLVNPFSNPNGLPITPSDAMACGVWGFWNVLNFYFPVQFIATPIAIIVAGVVLWAVWKRKWIFDAVLIVEFVSIFFAFRALELVDRLVLFYLMFPFVIALLGRATISAFEKEKPLPREKESVGPPGSQD